MRCPKCDSDSAVTETRIVAGNNRRRRRCSNIHCDHRFTTIEAIVQSNQKHNDTVVLILPKLTVREMRKALALLDRGLAGELSQDLRGDARDGEPERTERAEGDPLAVAPPPRIEDAS